MSTSPGREIDPAVGRVRTRIADLPQVRGRVVALERELRGLLVTVQRIREDLEDLGHDLAESSQ